MSEQLDKILSTKNTTSLVNGVLFVVLGVFILSCSPKEHPTDTSTSSSNFQVSEISSTTETLSYDQYGLPEAKNLFLKVCFTEKISGEKILETKFRVISDEKEKIVKTDSSTGCVQLTQKVSFSFTEQSQYIKNDLKISSLEYFQGEEAISYEYNPWLEHLPNTGKKEFYDLRFFTRAKKSFVQSSAAQSAEKGPIVQMTKGKLATFISEEKEINSMKLQYEVPVKFKHTDSSGHVFYLDIPKAEITQSFILTGIMDQQEDVLGTIENSILTINKKVPLNNKVLSQSNQLIVGGRKYNLEGNLTNQKFELEVNTDKSTKKQISNLIDGDSITLDSVSINLDGRQEWDVQDSLDLNLIKHYQLQLNLKQKLPLNSSNAGNPYSTLPDADYKMGVIYLKNYFEGITYKKSKLPLPPKAKVYTNSNLYDVKVENGKILQDIKIILPDFQFLTNRSIFLIDLYPANQKVDGQKRISRFVIEVVLQKNKIRVIANSKYTLSNLKNIEKNYLPYLSKSFQNIKEEEIKQQNLVKQYNKDLFVPEKYAKYNNLFHFDNKDLAKDKKLDFIKLIYKYAYKNEKSDSDIFIRDLCKFWAKNILKNKNESKAKNKQLISKFRFSCIRKGLQDFQNIFRVFPIFMDLEVSNSVADGPGSTDVITVSQNYASTTQDYQSTEAVTSASTPSAFPLKFGLNYNIGKQTNITDTVDSGSHYYFNTEIQNVAISVKKVRPCLLIVHNKAVIKEIAEKMSGNILSYFFKKKKIEMDDKGVLYCEDKIVFKEAPLVFKTKYYFFTQRFNANLVHDETKEENQPWMLSIRGESQLRLFTHFLNLDSRKLLAPIGQEENFSRHDPSFRLKNIYTQFFEHKIGQATNVHYVSPIDLHNFNKMDLK